MMITVRWQNLTGLQKAAEHLWCDFKCRPWATNSSRNTRARGQTLIYSLSSLTLCIYQSPPVCQLFLFCLWREDDLDSYVSWCVRTVIFSKLFSLYSFLFWHFSISLSLPLCLSNFHILRILLPVQTFMKCSVVFVRPWE